MWIVVEVVFSHDPVDFYETSSFCRWAMLFQVPCQIIVVIKLVKPRMIFSLVDYSSELIVCVIDVRVLCLVD